MSIEGTIRITDGVVAQKEKEIQELKRLLDDQSSNLGSVAVGASAIAGMLDQDDLIRQERERLAEQQEEWREKLRQAEIDISVERAKIARERTELEEKLRAFQDEMAKQPADDADKPKAEKQTGRRWLSRLGLKDSDEE